MAAWQRFLDAVRLKAVDHVPVVLLGTPRFFASLAGIKLRECLHDPCKLMEVELEAFEKFPDVTFIPGCWPDYGAGLFSAFGARIAWFDDSMPSVKEPRIRSKDDIHQLNTPNPHTDGLMPWHLETLRLFVERKREFRDNLHFLHACCPGELAAHLWGIDAFLLNVSLDPDSTKALLEKLTEATIVWLRAQSEILRDAQGMLVTDDLSGLMSPEMYEKFLFPCHCRIREAFKDHLCVFHCDTKSDHILDFLPKVGVDVFHLGPTTDLADAKRRLGNKVCLMGNVDPVAVMQHKDARVVEQAAERCLRKAMGGGGYLLSAGGGMNENTPEENVKALMDVAKSKGAYQAGGKPLDIKTTGSG